MDQSAPQATAPDRHVDVVVVGAGFAGLYAHHRLRAEGFTIAGFEAAPDVGGTWYWNAYPGARCDVESLDYCYSFSRELLDDWIWSERYATQPEILRYAGHVADRFDLRRDIRFSTRVSAATFDEATGCWIVETDRGDTVSARFLIGAVGCLSAPKPPEFDGLDDFAGRWVHTAAWPHEKVELEGKRVAVIGTGSSGIQTIPVIASQAAQLTVFQRTPNFSIPACNGPVDPDYEASIREDYLAHVKANRFTKGGVQSRYRTELSANEVSEDHLRETFGAAWERGGASIQSVYSDLLTDVDANAKAAQFVHEKIREIVDDPQVAQMLTPTDHPLGTKRICLDSEYYATFNQPHVELVDIRATPIERITRDGIATSAREYPADLIVFATGFDAVIGAFVGLNVTGRNGVNLSEAWRSGPSTYLGLMVSGFPNFFTVNGPGSPSVLANMMVAIEQHIDWIVDTMKHLRAHGIDLIDADQQAQDAWAKEVQAVANMTLYPRANSWYNGDNVPGKPRLFLPYVGGLDTYSDRCEAVVSAGYEGFVLKADAPAQEAAGAQ